MIDKEKMLQKLCVSYPGLRKQLVSTADDWISLDGEILWFVVIGCVSKKLINNLIDNNYDNCEQLFECVEELISCGSEEVENLITTGFLESMLNSRKLDESLWRPLIGIGATKFCNSLDEHYN